MKKCCFIIPYFGELPNYFQLFVKTCGKNKDFNWLLVTDNKINFNLPDNFKVIYMSFSEMKELVQSKFDFPISLETPYKLCDYKPAYGYIFEDQIKNFKSWGHCDVDILVGNLSKFITNEMLEKYDKMFCLGHMIIYKNSYENNRVFMSSISSEKWYEESFSTNKITIFDETYKNNKNVNTIFLKNKKKVLQEDYSFNVKILPTKFVRTKYNYLKKDFDDEKYKNAVYCWNNGKIVRYYLENGKCVEEEYMYIHLQERKMKFNKKVLNNQIIQIVPNIFKKCKYNDITLQNFSKIKKKSICFHYFQFHFKWQKRKIKRFLNAKRGMKSE